MPANYVYTDLSVKDALYLEMDGVKYPVVQFSSTWAANEIPSASVMLAVGRSANKDTFGQKAPIHRASRLKQMTKATVWFTPTQEYDRNNDWPVGSRKIFDGYFTGFAYRKVSGKVHAIGNLIHWLAALGFSSSLTKNSHVSNPTALNAAAVLESLGTSGAGQGNYVSALVPAQVIASTVSADVWLGMKTIFCKLASVPTMPCGPEGTAACGGTGEYFKNDVALTALSKIEGPADDCNTPYRYGRALKLDTLGIPAVDEAVAEAIGQEFIESYSGTSFWDKLIANWCPMFGMALVPMVDSAVVIADVPAYNGGYWKEIKADDYDSYDLTRDLHRPLRAVGVVAGWASQTSAGNTEEGNQFDLLGGCYVEDSVEAADGMIQYVAPPPWLRMLNSQSIYAGFTTGVNGEKPSKTGSTPVNPQKPSDTPDSFGENVNSLYQRFAHDVFVNQMLRGQGGGFSGKLRFDIAPLSILKINATAEKFIGPGQDDLAMNVFGCVQRVTISINAEAGMAGTTFQLSHVRTGYENEQPRTSVAEHPLFGAAIHGGGKHGCPLVPDYDIGPAGSTGPPAELDAGGGPQASVGTVNA